MITKSKQHYKVSETEYFKTGQLLDLATTRFIANNPTYRFTHGRDKVRDMVLTVALMNAFKRIYKDE